jgi:hypothetical protein
MRTISVAAVLITVGAFPAEAEDSRLPLSCEPTLHERQHGQDVTMPVHVARQMAPQFQRPKFQDLAKDIADNPTAYASLRP